MSEMHLIDKIKTAWQFGPLKVVQLWWTHNEVRWVPKEEVRKRVEEHIARLDIHIRNETVRVYAGMAVKYTHYEKCTFVANQSTEGVKFENCVFEYCKYVRNGREVPSMAHLFNSPMLKDSLL